MPQLFPAVAGPVAPETYLAPSLSLAPDGAHVLVADAATAYSPSVTPSLTLLPKTVLLPEPQSSTGLVSITVASGSLGATSSSSGGALVAAANSTGALSALAATVYVASRTPALSLYPAVSLLPRAQATTGLVASSVAIGSLSAASSQTASGLSAASVGSGSLVADVVSAFVAPLLPKLALTPGFALLPRAPMSSNFVPAAVSTGSLSPA